MKFTAEAFRNGAGNMLVVVAVLFKRLAKTIIKLAVMFLFAFMAVRNHAMLILRMLVQEVERQQGNAEQYQEYERNMCAEFFQAGTKIGINAMIC